MSEITYDYINQYIRTIQPKNHDIVTEIENEARINQVPIVPQEVASLLRTILSIKKPERILEIGTAVGYSSILMSNYLQENGKIITIERYDIMKEKAKENIKKAELEDVITMLEGDAEEILPTLTEEFDIIFLDAAKGQYYTFLPHCLRLLKRDGILIADDVLHKGMIAKSRYSIPRRQRTIHKRMRNFLWDITHHPDLETSILPIGDGVALCYKKN